MMTKTSEKPGAFQFYWFFLRPIPVVFGNKPHMGITDIANSLVADGNPVGIFY
jgi:hypothetical protein